MYMILLLSLSWRQNYNNVWLFKYVQFMKHLLYLEVFLLFWQSVQSNVHELRISGHLRRGFNPLQCWFQPLKHLPAPLRIKPEEKN